MMTKLKIAGIVVGVLLVLYVTSILTQNSRLRDKANQLDGQYAVLATQYEELESESLAYIKMEFAHIAVRDAQIARLEQDIVEKHKVISKDAVAFNKAMEELEGLKGTEGYVASLELNLSRAVKIIDDQAGVIKGQESIIFNLKEKYKAQVVISDTYKVLWEGQVGLGKINIKRLTIAEKRLKNFGFTNKLFGTAAVVLGGYLAYDLIRR